GLCRSGHRSLRRAGDTPCTRRRPKSARCPGRGSDRHGCSHGARRGSQISRRNYETIMPVCACPDRARGAELFGRCPLLVEQLELDRELNVFRAVRHADLLLNSLLVRLDRLGADVQLLPDFRTGVATRDMAKYETLALAERRKPFAVGMPWLLVYELLDDHSGSSRS